MIVQLPSWASSIPLPVSASDEDVMNYVIELARANVRHATGGPFACAIVDDAGGVLGIGVNLVEQTQCSVFHAEMVAIVNASDHQASRDLGIRGPATLYSSAEPCAMCMGAIPWSGVHRIVVAARDVDVRAIGFDEGVKPIDWIDVYRRRGIDVTRDVLRDDAVAVLRAYAQGGGLLYNG
jgi:tRNA(Arg) A34 adenosine deaminase TadA